MSTAKRSLKSKLTEHQSFNSGRNNRRTIAKKTRDFYRQKHLPFLEVIICKLVKCIFDILTCFYLSTDELSQSMV